jgi:hypothetical protein
MQDESTVASAALTADAANSAALAKGVANIATSDVAMSAITTAGKWIWNLF